MDNLEPLTIPYYMDCLAKGYRYVEWRENYEVEVLQ